MPHVPDRGFTLVEILVSVAILSVSAVLILQACARGAQALAVARTRLRAYAFMSQKLGELELAPPGQPVKEAEGSFRIGEEAFAWRLGSGRVPEDVALEVVTLTVEWRRGRTPYSAETSLVRRLPLAITEP